MIISTIALTIALAPQDNPVDIPKNELPKTAPCVVCNAAGANHGDEKPAAGVKYKGKTYFFCNAKEVAEFKKDPVAYVPPVLPRPAPTFDLKDTSGKSWNASTMKDKIVLIDFWATWCGPCKQAKPAIDKVYQTYKSKGLEVLSVSIDEKEKTLTDFLAKNKFDNPVVFDSNQTWNAWGVRVIPTFFVVKNGQILVQWSGVKKAAEVEAVVKPHIN